MSKQIIKRMEELLHTSNKGEEKAICELSAEIIECAKQRRLREMQSELMEQGEMTDITETLDRDIPIKELIDARIAQTEDPGEVIQQQVPLPKKDDLNRTLINLDSLAASIYFWSPNATCKKENKKQRFMQDKFRTSYIPNEPINSSIIHRNKEAFINFSQPALIMVAGNPETPPSTLKWLAAHHSAEVRKAVAQNENIDHETLNLLAEDFDSNVQSAVLDNARISKDLTVKLATSKNFSIASKARNVFYQLEMKSKQPSSLIKAPQNADELLKNERAFLKAIADSDTSRRLIVKSSRIASDWHIRMLVAGDPNATAEILWQLASHPISQVKRKLVDKYNCLLETMVNLKGYKKSGDTLAASSTETIN